MTLLYLIAAHFLCDYPLQGDYLAKMKGSPDLATRWYHLFGHSAIHAAAVGAITGHPLLAMAEFVSHLAIDNEKVRGRIGYATDQSLHIACKVAWFLLFVIGNPLPLPEAPR